MTESIIVAMGGGGFSMEPNNLALDQFILELTGVDRPRVCFVPTASGDANQYVERFYECFGALPCEPSDLSLFRRTGDDLRERVLAQDVIYVGVETRSTCSRFGGLMAWMPFCGKPTSRARSCADSAPALFAGTNLE